MRFISRSDMGWPSSAAPQQLSNPRGVKIHYEGTRVPVVEHNQCVKRWTAIRNSHLANKQEGYSDVAYNLAVCRHGYVLEGRGAGRRTGANGNQSLNAEHYAVLVMIGSEGDTRPTAEAVVATREAIQYLRTHAKPAGREIKGHRDGFATSCPGGPLYDLVGSGQLEPSKNDTPTPAPPKPVYAPFPGRDRFGPGKSNVHITALGHALVKAGHGSHYSKGPGPRWSETDRRNVASFQRAQGWTGDDADGYPGPETWKRLKVPKY